MMKTGVFLLSLFGVLALMITAGANATGPDHPAVSYTLASEMKGEKRLFVGAGGKIKGMVNPDLFVNEWDVVEITLINGDNLNHHIAIPNFHILSETVSEKGKKTTITFVPFKSGGFDYYCLLDNHRALGMEGKIVVVKK